MKKIFKWGLLASLSAFTIVGCSDDGSAEDILTTPTEPVTDPITGEEVEVEVATIQINEADPDNDIVLAMAEGEAGGTVPGRVIFTTAEGSTQRRLYVTQTLPGETAMPFEIEELSRRGTKADGSIDLDDEAKDAFDFTFELNVPEVENGTIVYNFWSTTGKGNFRDSKKRLLNGVGTIEVSIGDGVDASDASVRDITDVQLFAPDSEGRTAAFFSLLTGEEYVVVSIDGLETSGPEFRFLWDLGYYYTSEAAFASTSFYSTAFPFEVEGFEASPEEIDEGEVLNNTYFSLSNLTSAEFDAITMSSELEGITNSNIENIEGLVVGSVVEFVDNYDHKGLIKITGLDPGFNNDDSITFDVKIQP